MNRLLALFSQPHPRFDILENKIALAVSKGNPNAVMNVSKNVEAAQAFLEFLTTDAADAVFENVGFTPVA